MIVKHVLSNCRFFVSKSSNKKRFLLPIKQQLALFSSSKFPQMSSSSIDINPKCYPIVERGNVVDDYHGKKVFLKIFLKIILNLFVRFRIHIVR